jgi:hypothetical protein
VTRGENEEGAECRRLLVSALGNVARLHANRGHHAAARPLLEEALQLSQQQASDGRGGGWAPEAIHAMSNLGVCLSNIGDMQLGLALKARAAQLALRVLGDAHPQARSVVQTLAASRRGGEMGEVRAIARLVGLSRRLELNGALVFVLGFSAEKNRYRVAVHDSPRPAKPLGIKPANLVLKYGSAVTIQCDNGSNGGSHILADEVAQQTTKLRPWAGQPAIIVQFNGERSVGGASTGDGEYSARPFAQLSTVLQVPLDGCILEETSAPTHVLVRH